METDALFDRGILVVGILVVAGVLYYSVTSSPGITGGAVLIAKPSCCLDCTCVTDDVCASCGRCLWLQECGSYGGGLNPEGLELVHAGRTRDDSTYTINAVLHPVAEGKLLLLMGLPNGFEPVAGNPVVVSLRPDETVIVPLKLYVKENVAEQQHLVRIELLDYDWNLVSSAEASVDVYSGRRLSP